MSEPLYYAKGLDVWKRSVETSRTEAGGRSFSLGFKVCTVSDVVGEEGAEAVAAMLTFAETSHQSPGEGS